LLLTIEQARFLTDEFFPSQLFYPKTTKFQGSEDQQQEDGERFELLFGMEETLHIMILDTRLKHSGSVLFSCTATLMQLVMAFSIYRV